MTGLDCVFSILTRRTRRTLDRFKAKFCRQLAFVAGESPGVTGFFGTHVVAVERGERFGCRRPYWAAEVARRWGRLSSMAVM